MDIVVRTILNLVQKTEGFEDAVIAGGSVRDYLLKGKPKDYDIFIPERSKDLMDGLHKKIFELTRPKEEVVQRKTSFAVPGGTFNTAWNGLGNPWPAMDVIEEFPALHKKAIKTLKVKPEYPESEFSVDKFEYEGYQFDLIVRKDIKEYDIFGDTLVGTFNFGINMAYYDGIEVHTSDKFTEDRNNYTCTLWNCRDIDSELPKAFQKASELNAKYGFRFRNMCLEVVKKDSQ
jgi:hypothetical protein